MPHQVVIQYGFTGCEAIRLLAAVSHSANIIDLLAAMSDFEYRQDREL